MDTGIMEANSQNSVTEVGYASSNIMIHDAIHGSYYLPDIAWMIIDTPIFQRLRKIKQTANTVYVYPGAEHTRFQHCLGVAYLSLEFGKAIKLKYADLITDHQILLLCLAGLCHDLGHCAYSHLYDSHIIPLFNSLESSGSESSGSKPEEPSEPSGTSIATISCHEEASFLLIEKLHDELDLDLSDNDIRIIGKMIFGSESKLPSSLRTKLKWSEEEHTNQYLFEVVSNSRTGIDVDKFDYLKRDSHYTGIPCTFDPQRLMAFFSIIKSNGKYLIEYPRKSEIINSMWLSRDELHRRAYQHRVVKCIDLMTSDMIVACKDAEIIPGYTLRNAHHNLDAYLVLTDAKIMALAEKVPEANAILKKIEKRELWRTLATVYSSKILDFKFSDTCVRTACADFKDGYVYYIYYTSQSSVHPHYAAITFLIELVSQAKGESIKLREEEDMADLLSHLFT